MTWAATSERGDARAHGMALVAGLVLIGAFLSVLLSVTLEFGGTRWLLAYVLLAFLAATAAARALPTGGGLAVGSVILVVGLAGYLTLLPSPYYGLFTVENLLADLAGWLTGRSVILMLEVDLWAVGVAPAPVFLTWYLALRRRYDVAALVGGLTLSFFVLTGDAGEPTTLVGMVGLLGLLGFGAVERTEGGWNQLQELGLVIGVAVLVASMIQVVPAGGRTSRGGGGGDGDGGGGGGTSLEETLVDSPNEYRVGGSVSLSPEPRFHVQAEAPAYWHVRSLDRYTGSGWRRTTDHAEAVAPLTSPPGDAETVRQVFVARGESGVMPFAWKPVLLGSDTRTLASVTPTGELSPRGPLSPGESYSILSDVPAWEHSDLQAAGDEYLPAVRQRYLQLPGDVPDRLGEKTAEIAAGAETPYETAVAIQGWLDANKDYSLEVNRPEWDIADAFVFSMSEGYCVYFATAMTVMLRTQGVPARFVVGYSTGEQVDDRQWLLRGLHSHAWVEVYFPDVGWVPFDPTPGRPRQRARERRLAESGAAAPGDDSTGETSPTATSTLTPTATPSPAGPTATGNESFDGPGDQAPAVVSGNSLGGESLPSTTEPDPGVDGPAVVRVGEEDGSPTPTGSTAGGAGGSRDDRLWLLGALATATFGSVRLGVAQSALREVWVRWQPRTGSPERDLQRALDRLEYHLASQFRERDPGETWQQYVRAARERDPRVVDGRVRRVVELHQQSRYGDGCSRSAADEAIQLVDDLVRSR